MSNLNNNPNKYSKVRNKLDKFRLFRLKKYKKIISFNDIDDNDSSNNSGVYGKFRQRLHNIKLARFKKFRLSRIIGFSKTKREEFKKENKVFLDSVVKEIRDTSKERNYKRRKRAVVAEDDELDISIARKEVTTGIIYNNEPVDPEYYEEYLYMLNESDYTRDKDGKVVINGVVVIDGDKVSRSKQTKDNKKKSFSFSYGSTKRELSAMSIEERKKRLKTLGVEITKKIREGFEEKLDELEVLESELWLLNQQHNSEVELERVREIKKKINDLIDKLNLIIKQYNLYAESYYMDNVIGLDDNVLLDDIIDYRTLLDSFEGEQAFIEEVKALDEFKALYDSLVEIKADTEKLQEENEEKIEEYDIRDKKYDSIKLEMISALDIGKKTDLEVSRQNEYIKRLMEDIEKIDRHEYVTSHLRGVGALLSSSLRYMRALVMSPLSGMIPGIGMQALVARRMIANAYRHLHFEDINHVYYEAIDYDSELNHHLLSVSYVEDMVDGAIKDVSRLREEFMSIYDRRIPGYEDTLKKIGEIEKNLVRSQNRVLLAKKNLKRSKKINENKLVRVRKLNDEAKKNAA